MKPEEKAAAYVSIALAQTKVGDAVAACKNLEVALIVAAKIVDERAKESACLTIAAAEAEVGHVADAKAIAAKITSEEGKAATYSKIAAAQVRAKDLAAARQTLELAENSAGKITEEWFKNLARLDILGVKAEAGNVAGAKRMVEQFNAFGGVGKANAYRVIAEAQANAGDVAGARQTLELAKTSALGIGVEAQKGFGDLAIAQACNAIAVAEAKAGDVAAAKMTAAQIGYDGMRAITYLAIAETQARSGDAAGARQGIELAKAAMAKVADDMKVTAYLELARVQTEAGDASTARESMRVARAAAAMVGSGRSGKVATAVAYSEIAMAEAWTGDLRGAKATAAQINGETGMQEGAYHAIVAAQAKAGDAAGAIDYCSRVQSDPNKRCKCLAEAATELYSAVIVGTSLRAEVGVTIHRSRLPPLR